MVTKLRQKFEEEGLQLLEKSSQDSAAAIEIFAATLKRLTRRKQALKERNKLIPKGKELQQILKPHR